MTGEIKMSDLYTKKTGHFKSSNGISRISYYIYEPKTAPVATVQIVHGMSEFIERYEEFAEFLCKNSVAVFGNDHIGHGNSVESYDDLGHFFTPNGWRDMISDAHTMSKIGAKLFPNIPHIIFGHSMGSFVTKGCMIKFPSEIDCVILSGTGENMPFATASLALIESLIKIRGGRERSEFIYGLAFGKFNSHIDSPRTQSDWLTRDCEKIKEYVSDLRCITMFTLNGFDNLAKLMNYVNSDKWYEKVSKTLPILMMSGEEDPVGGWGEGVRSVYGKLLENGCNAALKMYDGCRHELVNELNRHEVYSDVLTAIKKTLEI